MGDESPAGFVFAVNVGAVKGWRRCIGGWSLDGFLYEVNRYIIRFNPSQVGNRQRDAMALGKQAGKHLRHTLLALHQGMHGQQATDVIGLRPDGEQLIQLTCIQRIVKGIFSILGVRVCLDHVVGPG